jgi:hypothetical protein
MEWQPILAVNQFAAFVAAPHQLGLLVHSIVFVVVEDLDLGFEMRGSNGHKAPPLSTINLGPLYRWDKVPSR